MVGDGYCNDETNNIHCDFDGGDCCYSCVSTLFCTDCKCLTGNSEKEINYLLIGDGFCHDEINTADCNYDDGDCCGPCVLTEWLLKDGPPIVTLVQLVQWFENRTAQTLSLSDL